MEMKSSFVFLALALVGLAHVASAQNSYVVLDSAGWSIPSGGAAAYTTWAANKTFSVGDILVFNFATGQHDVAEVTKAAYDSCNGNNPISMHTTGPANISLGTAGEHYFICTFSGHCSAGQKLAINVNGGSSPSPASPPSPTTPTPPSSTASPPSSVANPPSATTNPTGPTNPASPPQDSSAKSIGITGFSATILSIAVALCF